MIYFYLVVSNLSLSPIDGHKRTQVQAPGAQEHEEQEQVELPQPDILLVFYGLEEKDFVSVVDLLFEFGS